MANEKSVFETLNAVNCNEHTESKNGLTYLSWAWAWAEVKKAYPKAEYTVYEGPNGMPYITDGRTCMVKTGVTIEGLEHIEYLPVMDYNNRSIPFERVTTFDVNKAIQRSLTKACARHGLGLYIYAGEDLPEAEAQAEPQEVKPVNKVVAARKAATKKAPAPLQAYEPVEEELYWRYVKGSAHGKESASGKPARQAWIEYTHATEEAIAKFDHDVDMVLAAEGA